MESEVEGGDCMGTQTGINDFVYIFVSRGVFEFKSPVNISSV